jgi:D-mannonate dehydratase
MAVPSAAVFFDAWAPVADGREVVLLYHSDYPITAGLNGMKRVAGTLGLAKSKPSRLLGR